jgi:hypothetical protein
MTTETKSMVIDPDDPMPARVRLIDRLVDTLQEGNDNWYAEQESPSSITLNTPLGKYTIVVVEDTE